MWLNLSLFCLLLLQFMTSTNQFLLDKQISAACRSNATDCDEMEICCVVSCNFNENQNLTVSLCLSNSTRETWSCKCEFQRELLISKEALVAIAIGCTAVLTLCIGLIISYFVCCFEQNKRGGGQVLVLTPAPQPSA